MDDFSWEKMRTDAKRAKWAVMSIDYCMFGFGKTKKEALADAVKWTDVRSINELNIVDCYEARNGDMILTDDRELIEFSASCLGK